MIRKIVSMGVFLLVLSYISASGCIAQETDALISFTGQVTYIDLEGGFYGILAQDGQQYLPLDLPEEYQQDGLVVDVTGVIDPDVMTIQMWGQPLRIETITVSQEMPSSSDFWYEGQSAGLSPEQESAMKNQLLQASTAVSAALQGIDMGISDVAADLKGKNLMSTDLTPYLEKVVQGNPAIYEATIIDRSGKIVAVFPDTYQESVGTDVSAQPLVTALKKNPVPGMSEYVETVEGEYAINILYPVYSSSLSVIGYLSVLIHPQLLIGETLDPVLNDSDISAFVVEPSGTVLGMAGSFGGMSAPEASHGPVSIPESIKSILASYPAGSDMMILGTGTPDSEQASQVYWTSVFLHNIPWRILVSR